MGIMPEQEHITILLYTLSGELRITIPDGDRHLYANDCMTFNDIRHTYMIQAVQSSNILIYSNTESLQKVDASNAFRKQIEEIEAKDIYTKGQSMRVRQYATAIALELDPSFDIIPLSTAAGLHDLGKCNTPNELLQKPGKLTQEEIDIIRQHPLDTYEMMRQHFDDSLARLAAMHHERLDASGYPYGLKQDQLPLEALIIAVADAFDAMMSNRNYKRNKSYEEAIQELLTLPEQFDQGVVKALQRCRKHGALCK